MAKNFYTKNLCAGYKSKTKEYAVVKKGDLTFNPGELVCLIGPNGSGKSTLLKTLAGLIPPLRGSVYLGGKNIQELSAKERSRQLALVLTSFPRVHGMTGWQSVALGRSPHTGWLGSLKEADEQQIRQALQITGCEKLAHRFVDSMSDGERQRLAIARALAQEAEIILLDEPTAFLDLPHRVQLFVFLRKLAREQKRTVVLSIHDLELALRFADNLVVIDQGFLHSNLPEELVLNGTMQKVFSKDEVQFDVQTGSFKVDEKKLRPISCVGEGLAQYWTQRALERHGWVLREGVFPRIEVQMRASNVLWKMSLNQDQESEFVSLKELLHNLQEF
ncbi:MAG: ABC transporter ATP-binding protein [Fibrobacter sp.]|nr:ABC transporter ATP-binding protein [Fibrobacter sp.]